MRAVRRLKYSLCDGRQSNTPCFLLPDLRIVSFPQCRRITYGLQDNSRILQGDPEVHRCVQDVVAEDDA